MNNVLIFSITPALQMRTPRLRELMYKALCAEPGSERELGNAGRGSRRSMRPSITGLLLPSITRDCGHCQPQRHGIAEPRVGMGREDHLLQPPNFTPGKQVSEREEKMSQGHQQVQWPLSLLTPSLGLLPLHSYIPLLFKNNILESIISSILL